MEAKYYLIWFAVGYIFPSVPIEVALQQFYRPGFYTPLCVLVGILTAGIAGWIDNRETGGDSDE